jgi:hypothetical protein
MLSNKSFIKKKSTNHFLLQKAMAEMSSGKKTLHCSCLIVKGLINHRKKDETGNKRKKERKKENIY